jgi:hypothetical protein
MDKTTADTIQFVATMILLAVIYMSVTKSWPWQNKK